MCTPASITCKFFTSRADYRVFHFTRNATDIGTVNYEILKWIMAKVHSMQPDASSVFHNHKAIPML